MSGKLGRYIFRKIGGRIVPIKINNIADKIANASSRTDKYRKITATAKGQLLGVLNLQIPKRGKSAIIKSVNVEKQFRRKGISKNLFARATQFLERAKYKFLRSDEIQHSAQIKIRKKYGRYKAGPVKKNRTKFFADQFGAFGEETRRIDSLSATDILKYNRSGRQITATTMLKKYKK